MDCKKGFNFWLKGENCSVDADNNSGCTAFLNKRA